MSSLIWTMNDNKSDLTRANLQFYGIYYDQQVYQVNADQAQPLSPYRLPDHIDAVREGLLTFRPLIPENGWDHHLKDEFKKYGSEQVGPASNLQPPASAIVRLKAYDRSVPTASPEWMAARADCENLQNVAMISRKLVANAATGWQHFWREEVFKLHNKAARTQPEYSVLLDTWSLEEDVLWDSIPEFEPRNVKLKSRTKPKPDLTYAFPIIQSDPSKLKGFERDDFRQCFSLRVLGELKRNGVCSTPTTGLGRWLESPDTANLLPGDLACFPWAVVEIKRNDESSEECYCRAANAAAAALTLQTQLLRKADSKCLPNLPPVIAFTCVGPIIKVWLASQTSSVFSWTQSRMVCIWSTTTQLTWGVAAIREIIANMHVWASRILKPKIQAWVLQASKQPTPNKAPLF